MSHLAQCMSTCFVGLHLGVAVAHPDPGEGSPPGWPSRARSPSRTRRRTTGPLLRRRTATKRRAGGKCVIRNLSSKVFMRQGRGAHRCPLSQRAQNPHGPGRMNHDVSDFRVGPEQGAPPPRQNFFSFMIPWYRQRGGPKSARCLR